MGRSTRYRLIQSHLPPAAITGGRKSRAVLGTDACVLSWPASPVAAENTDRKARRRLGDARCIPISVRHRKKRLDALEGLTTMGADVFPLDHLPGPCTIFGDAAIVETGPLLMTIAATWVYHVFSTAIVGARLTGFSLHNLIAGQDTGARTSAACAGSFCRMTTRAACARGVLPGIAARGRHRSHEEHRHPYSSTSATRSAPRGGSPRASRKRPGALRERHRLLAGSLWRAGVGKEIDRRWGP